MDSGEFALLGIDHVQVAMPPDKEDAVRGFYRDLLGLTEIPKPEPLAARGGVWFALGDRQLHLGVEHDFHPARKAHPAFAVKNLRALASRLERSGVPIVTDAPIDGCDRIFVSDPFGNRIELLERTS
jgi:catechol 2,3-dioxygenase-like lactoylglutathione lyase family enzyme